MAAQAQAPIVPIVLHGTRFLWPKWWQYSEPGIVTIRILKEIPPPPDANDNIVMHRLADELRDQYKATLTEMERTVPWQ